MGKLKRIETEIEGVYIIEPIIFGDERGFFFESYNKRDFQEIGILDEFVQDNHSKSRKGVLRGLHFQTEHSQGKLIRVIKGGVLDIAVDLRKNSATFGKSIKVELTEENRRMLYIPKNFAHGFLTITEEAECLYKCNDYYYPEYESGIIWDDSELNIDWELKKYNLKKEDLIFSEKDKIHQSFKEYRKAGEER